MASAVYMHMHMHMHMHMYMHMHMLHVFPRRRAVLAKSRCLFGTQLRRLLLPHTQRVVNGPELRRRL